MRRTEFLRASGEPATVLVVDDEAYNVDLLCQELEELELGVETAVDGIDALNRLAEVECDLMLLDILMPRMDGMTVLGKLHERETVARMPVIMVSALDDISLVAKCLELGAEDHLVKPFEPALLKARIGGALAKKRLHDQVARELESTRETFGKYVPDVVAGSILAGAGKLEPVHKIATILYFDIEGFTGIAEQMDPGEVMNLLNNYFAAVAAPISRCGGVINQFQGDAILATFNVPTALDNHADCAVSAAREIQSILVSKEFCGHRLRVRMGINTGQVVAGNVGTGDRLHYTVHGDAVNVAARLESLNKQLGTNVLISGSSADRLEASFPLRRVGEIPLRGKTETVSLYCLPVEDLLAH